MNDHVDLFPGSYPYGSGSKSRSVVQLSSYLVNHRADPPQRLCCTLFGKGRLDIPWLINGLREINYGGNVSVEYEACWHPEYHLPPAEDWSKHSKRVR